MLRDAKLVRVETTEETPEPSIESEEPEPERIDFKTFARES